MPAAENTPVNCASMFGIFLWHTQIRAAVWRDLLVNEEDMGEALSTGKVAKYVTDFPTKKIANMENVIAFPHLETAAHKNGRIACVKAILPSAVFLLYCPRL